MSLATSTTTGAGADTGAVANNAAASAIVVAAAGGSGGTAATAVGIGTGAVVGARTVTIITRTFYIATVGIVLIVIGIFT